MTVSTPRKPRTAKRWLRQMAGQAHLDVTEAVARAKAETWAALVDACGYLESEADRLIEQALADLAGYQGTERLEYVRRQLSALRADLAAPADREPAEPQLVCVPWQVAP